ncbi:HAD hydrolase-like protein [Sphingomonas sp. GCM10030256]|uniref:HAD hydrolase-like protein n=1 Tax=Sphingomonas sp. GCM10030256 TaxID=3273427 RepID=UPI00360BF263
MSELDALPERYRLILCDLWGCVHDGYRLLPGAENRLRRWANEGRTVLFVTNAPRSSATIEEQLDRLGLASSLYAGVVSAGEVGITALSGRTVGFCGTEPDRADLGSRGLCFIDRGFDELACAGLAPGETVADYDERLAEWRSDEVLLHCLNPDRVVVHGAERMVCAGALADAYEEMGGRVCWYGKPHEATYEHALWMAGSPPKNEVLAVGDGLSTDMLGAGRFGIDAVFVSGGVHAGEPFPHDWAKRHGLAEWRPILAVERL